MGKNVTRTMSSDLRAYLGDIRYWLLNGAVVLVSAAMIAASWPAGHPLGFTRPLTGKSFFTGLAVASIATNLIFKNNLIKFPQVLTIREARISSGRHRLAFVLGLCLSGLVQSGFLVAMAIFPGVFVYLSGVLSGSQLAAALADLWVLGAIFSWLGLYLYTKFTHRLKVAGIITASIFGTYFLLGGLSLAYRVTPAFLGVSLTAALIGLADLQFDFHKLLFGG